VDNRELTLNLEAQQVYPPNTATTANTISSYLGHPRIYPGNNSISGYHFDEQSAREKNELVYKGSTKMKSKRVPRDGGFSSCIGIVNTDGDQILSMKESRLGKGATFVVALH
jgi:hypothetical protein